MRRFRAETIPVPGEAFTLGKDPSHHLLRVTGISPGESVEVFDGRGRSCFAVLESVVDGCAVLRATQERPIVIRPKRLLITGLLKGSAFDSLVRMSTELGVDQIWPVVLSRSVAKGDRLQRWNRIAASAAGQCGRSDIPEIRSPAPLSDCLDDVPSDMVRYVLVPGSPLIERPEGPAAVFLGAEGGLSKPEIAQSVEAGFQLAGLGTLTLRAESAAAAVLSRLL